MIKLSSTSIEINYNYNLKLNITRFFRMMAGRII